VGGIGFIVHVNLGSLAPWHRNRMLRGRLSLHTKIVLAGTLALLVGGTVAVLLLERRGALAGLSERDRWVGAFFQSVTCRTAGFNSVDLLQLTGISKALSILLMFIGGAPGSTAGGIKVSTAVVLAATVVAMVRNRDETEFGHRTVPVRAVRESIVIAVLSTLVVGVVSFALHLTEAASSAAMPASGLSLNLLFETVSAFGTVGLSLNTTHALSGAGLGCVIVCMFVGRLGPLTMALTMGGAGQGPSRRYPEENVVVG
jgi:trk system potassium uptake protein TrkH